MSQDNEILVKVDSVSKKFCRDLKKSLWYGMCDVASELLPFGKGAGRSEHGDASQETESLEPPEGGSSSSSLQLACRASRLHASPGLRPGEFWANKDISFELRRGECLGLIGRNGAGKTTLLKMLNGLIKPDTGTIEMRGRVGALIALGAGFNPILTGRENIYVNGSILGLTKEEIDDKIEDIIDFAEIRDFIDSPVQSYSSGMQVRLGFAVATALDPDVLILDEVLAVGDAAFRNKCYRRISALRESAAVIFVSHQMEQVARISDLALVMSLGKTLYLGNVEAGVAVYDQVNEAGIDQEDTFLALDAPITTFSYEFKSSELQSGAELLLTIHCESEKSIDEFILRLNFFSRAGEMVAASDLHGRDYGISVKQGENHWSISLPSLALMRGHYPISINLLTPTGHFLVWSQKQKILKVISNRQGPSAAYQPKADSWRTLEKSSIHP
jgi:lipopolysaccharide transport system ATP-binding protein